MTENGSSLQSALTAAQGRLTAVQDISRALAAPLELDLLLSVVMDKVSELMKAERSTLFILDPETGVLTSKVAQTDGEEPLRIRLELGEGIAGWVAMTGETVNMKDAYKDPRFTDKVDSTTGFRTHSILCKPMWNGQGATIGVIQVLNRKGGYFSQEDDELLEALAAQAAMSIENARMYVSLQSRNRELLEAKHQLIKKMEGREVLLAVEQVVSGQFKLKNILDRVLEELLDAIPSEAGSILLADDQSGALTFRSTVGPSGPALEHFSVPIGTGLVGWCAQKGESILCNDVANDNRHARKVAGELGISVSTALCVPIFSQDSPIGALQLLNSLGQRGEYNQEDLQLLTLVSGQVTRAIDASRARDEHLNENRLAAIGQSMSSVLHDFRTPMTVISGYIQLMEREHSKDDRSAYGQIIKGQINHLNTMVKEVLAFARGDVTLFIQKHFLGDFFNELVETLSIEMGAKNVLVESAIEDRGFAYFDGSKLRHSLFNLARNAREAMEGTLGKKQLSIRVYGDEEFWSVSIQDNGPGIPDEVKDTLFKEFVTHGKSNGTGLGLAIVKKVIEEHGGTIQVDSSVGKGAQFIITLPREAKKKTEE